MNKNMAKKDDLYVAGYFAKGPNEGKKVAIKVRNTLLLNPVEPIFETYPDVEVLVIAKTQKAAKAALAKLAE